MLLLQKAIKLTYSSLLVCELNFPSCAVTEIGKECMDFFGEEIHLVVSCPGFSSSDDFVLVSAWSCCL